MTRRILAAALFLTGTLLGYKVGVTIHRNLPRAMYRIGCVDE